MSGNEVWLELHNAKGTYSDPDKVHINEDDSQGIFAFGMECAKKVLANGGKNTKIGLAKLKSRLGMTR